MPNKVKFLFVTFGLSLTGGTVTFSQLSRELVHDGHDVKFLTIGDDYKGWFYDGVEVTAFPRLGGYTSSSKNLLNLARLARASEEADVKIATSSMTPFPGVLARARLSVYYMQHYETLFYSNRFKRLVTLAGYRLPYHHISNSTWLRERLNKVGVKSALVLPAIWYPQYFHPRNVEKATRPRVISLGRSDKIKGLSYLAKAMKVVRASIGDVELCLYGREPQLSSTIDCTYFTSPSYEELAVLNSTAHVSVCASLYESFPGPPLEAMACGTPVVTTRYGTEDFAFDGINSRVVPPGDWKSLANSIIEILTNQNVAEQFRSEGLKTARQFTLEKTYSMFMDAINNARN